MRDLEEILNKLDLLIEQNLSNEFSLKLGPKWDSKMVAC